MPALGLFARRLATVGCAGLAVALTLAPVGAGAKTSNTSKAPARVTFGVAPASATGLDSRPHFDFAVTPGATLQDHVAVLNYSAKPLSLQFYATDALNTANGGFTLLPATTKPVGAGAWITLPRPSTTVRVPAQSKKAPGLVIVPFLLRVPAGTTPGDHVGGIIASLRTVGRNASGQNVVLEQRIATRVYIRVSGTLAPNLTIASLHGSYHGSANPFGRGSVTVTYVVHNSGNVELALNQGISVTGLLGMKRQVVLPSVALLLPGDSLQESGTLNGVWPRFILHAKVTAEPFAAAGDTDPHALTATASSRLWAVPWALIALVVLVVVLLRFGLVVRKQRAGRPATVPAKQSVNA